MPSPSKETAQKSRRKPSTPRTSRSPWKGDKLGENKTQKSITNYFSVAPLRPGADSKGRTSVSSHKEDRKVQFEVKNMPARTPLVTPETITISDDDGSEQSNIENYHVKTKKRLIPLSRKLHNMKTDDSTELIAENSTMSPNYSKSSEDEMNCCSPTKRFRKQTLNSSFDVTSMQDVNHTDFNSNVKKSPIKCDSQTSQQSVNQEDTVVILSEEICVDFEETRNNNVYSSGDVGRLRSKFDCTVASTSSKILKEFNRHEESRQVCVKEVKSTSQEFVVSSNKIVNSSTVKSNVNVSTKVAPQIRLKNVTELLETSETANLDQVDWSPMEEEIKFSTPKKDIKTTSTQLEAANSPSKTVQSQPGPSIPRRSLFKSPLKEEPNSSATQQTPQTPKKSNSGPSTPKKSPYNRRRSPQKSPMKLDREAMSGDVALEHCILECKRYARFALYLNSSNKQVADNYLNLDLPEKKLLHKLLVRKWSWIRDVDMKYEEIVSNKTGSLDVLRDKGFLEILTSNEPLNVILDQLKRKELETLCRKYQINTIGTRKDELINSLCKFVNQQGKLGFSSRSLKSVITETALKDVGMCVRVETSSREILQKIFEASMSPLYLEGQFYSFQTRLAGLEKLLNEVKFGGRKLIPFISNDYQLFTSPAQFDEFIDSAILKFEILNAKEEKNQAKVLELATKARTDLMMYLNNPQVKEFLKKSPGYVWKYTAGSNYTSALTVGIEFLKRAKKYDDALVSLGVLLGQEHFRRHCRGSWYAEKVMIMDKQLKMPADVIYDVLVEGLMEELTPIGRLELSKKAASVVNKRKNGLTDEKKAIIMDLMTVPRLDHKVKEIRGTEAPNMSTGTRQMYVEYSGSGERTYFNVEVVARNSYLTEFPCGMHDEGALLKNIILAAFWPVIYASKENMFVSRYQNAPLDWGTRAFYANRRQEFEDHISKLRDEGIDGVMEQINHVVMNYANHHSVINWFHVNSNKILKIKNVLDCLTLDKFLKLSRYLLESYRERRSGWPDLTLWNAGASTFKLVEVKSPNDELSFKQIVWLEKFKEFDIDVEECRVNAPNKGKKRKMDAHALPSDGSQEVM